MTYTFTIIIPHKNIPKLLERCLASIPEREDLEIIIVDDNSDPNLVDFEHFPGKGRPHTTVILDKSGKGAGRARNIGLDLAVGKWIIFSDADDVFEPDFSKIIDSLIEDDDSDLVNFEVTSRNIEDDQPNDEIEKIGYHCNRPEYIHNPQSFKYIVLTPWGKAIKKDLIEKKQLRYEEVPFGNDLYFATLADFYCQHRRIIPLTGYCWMKRKESLWRQENLEWAKVRFKVLLHSASIMKNFGELDVAERYFGGANGFLNTILTYSKLEYLKSYVYYGIVKKDIKLLFWKFPKAIVRISLKL